MGRRESCSKNIRLSLSSFVVCFLIYYIERDEKRTHERIYPEEEEKRYLVCVLEENANVECLSMSSCLVDIFPIVVSKCYLLMLFCF
jgi:hypothetical protein